MTNHPWKGRGHGHMQDRNRVEMGNRGATEKWPIKRRWLLHTYQWIKQVKCTENGLAGWSRFVWKTDVKIKRVAMFGSWMSNGNLKVLGSLSHVWHRINIADGKAGSVREGSNSGNVGRCRGRQNQSLWCCGRRRARWTWWRRTDYLQLEWRRLTAVNIITITNSLQLHLCWHCWLAYRSQKTLCRCHLSRKVMVSPVTAGEINSVLHHTRHTGVLPSQTLG